MTYEQIDKVVVELILSVTSNRYVILLLINLILLILGMFIEVVAAIMIMLPILTPLMVIANISPIHMGVILVLNMMIGLLTPPVGMSCICCHRHPKRSFGRCGEDGISMAYSVVHSLGYGNIHRAYYHVPARPVWLCIILQAL